MKKLFLYVVLGLLWCNVSLASAELIFEYNEKLLNKKLSIKEIVKICKEYESKNINAAEYDQMTLNTDIGIHSYCTTTKMRNEFKQESKYNLVRDLDIEKFNFNYFTNEDYTISIPVSEITKSSSCFVNLKEEKSISYFEIKERCGVKKFITKELSNVCPATGCVLSTYEWTEDSELKNNRIRIIDYFYADANKDDYMDLIIRLKPEGSYSMGTFTQTIAYGKHAAGGLYTDTLASNQDYYYCFRSVDTHGNVSNPSHVYRIELVDNDGQRFLTQKVVYFESPTEKSLQPKKTGRKLIYIEPSESNLQFDSETYIDDPTTGAINPYATPNDNILGKQQVDNCWGEIFKIRVTSRKTGKKFDINVTFKNTGVQNP